MELVVAGTFGSLPEATIAFSSLLSAGFHPVAAFNMNTPGVAGGMAPSAYLVLAPETEAQAARRFLSEFEHAAIDGEDAEDGEWDQAEEQDNLPTGGVLSGLRPIVRILVCGLLVAWFAITCLMLLSR